MGWLWAIIVGFVLGLLAKLIIPGKQHSPLWLTTLMGLIGGIVGNAVARGIGIGATRGIDWGRHLLQLAAAIVLVFIGEMIYMSMHGRGRQRERI
ncbi:MULTISPECIES: GlsB/YeaQ/YmgE family stress response membrane protein [Streptomyces]|uniref:Integral membrane protein n=1 Tax=Streptomyces griseoaurantiacus M045 TaxID=996637 RepID=F3NQT0_9ACTN|nr:MULTISPECIES: GlsB/YeaQ/YmgE family stress response membrane protein [Streptomyces]EGG43914.1 integral membrane protein [Streptomyces griseoaurantiacus M045]NJP72101.1 GlsB/YeaQ/YmgE family stress response membrane protein [Streptomyces sp. C1-2]WTI26156.1 GlsB/YeaQ/YmgE family stress response membrane protein [Streptomyces jietaisiensis]